MTFSHKRIAVGLKRLVFKNAFKVAPSIVGGLLTLGFLIGYMVNGAPANLKRIEALEAKQTNTNDYIQSTFRYFSEMRANAKSKQDHKHAERLERLMKAAEQLTKENHNEQ